MPAPVVVELHRHAASQDRFYVNPFTGRSVWLKDFHSDMRAHVKNVDRDVVVVEAAAAAAVVVELHPHGNGHYYYVNPFTHKSVWVKDFHSDMRAHVKDVDRDVAVVVRRRGIGAANAGACNPQSACVLRARGRPPRRPRAPLAPAPASRGHCVRKPTAAARSQLRHVYVTVTSSAPAANKIPVAALNAGAARLVDLRLHKAMIPVSEYAVDAHNNAVRVEFGAGYASSATVAITPHGNYCAGEIAARLQALLAAATGAAFTVALSARLNRFTYSADVPFRFRVSEDAENTNLCARAAGLDGGDTSSAYRQTEDLAAAAVYLAAKLDAATGRYALLSTHIDVSGPRMLLVRVPAMHNRLVDAVSLVSNVRGAGAGFVRYENPHSGGVPRACFEPHRLFDALRFTLTTPGGRAYNLNGVAATYVFQLTMTL